MSKSRKSNCYQLLSSQSLFEKKSSLINDTSSDESDLTDLMSSMPIIPIRVNIKNKMNKINETNDDVDDEDDNSFIINVRNDNPLISEAKISIKIPSSVQNKSPKPPTKRHRILDDDFDESLALLKAGPKRSSEWSLFKNNNNNSSLIKSTSTTTTTKTTTTTTTKTFTDSLDNSKPNNIEIIN
jgi:hypothetical protein